MEGKKAKILAGAAGVVLVALELTLFLCFRLSRPFYLSTAVILSAVLAGTVTVLLCHALSPHGRAERMVRRPVLDGGEEVSAVRVEYSYFRKVAGLPSRFSLEALSAATDGFQYVVGRGSSGTVFKGILDDGTSVAVKRINGSAHVDKEFRSEVSAIGSVQHVSLVRLLGFCLVRNGPRFLVYEYMENGSLDRWIFPQHDAGGEAGGRCLTWVQRYQVAVDVAKALAYLHHDCRAKVVHLDVKPENILLDDRLRGMLSDFGLSTLMGKEQSRVVTTVRGTTGYLAPEWLLGAGVTEKSDVYSYGMVLMEILGGRRNLQAEPGPSGGSRRWSYFPKLVADRAQEGRVVELLDRRLVSSTVDEASVRRLAHVALWCAQEKPGARPHHGARRGDAGGQGRRRERGAAAAAVGHGPGGPARARSRADDRTVRAPRAATGTRLGGDGRVVGDEHGRFVRALLPVRPVAHDAQWLCRARQFRSDRSAIEDSTPRGCCHWTTQERCGDWCVVSDFSLTNCTTTECNH